MRVLQRSGGYVRVLDDDGVERGVTVAVGATDDQIAAAVVAARPAALGATSRAGLAADRDAKYDEWQRARTTRAEVIRRAVPAEQAWATGPNGLGFQWEETSWTAYRAAVLAWAAAT